VPCRVQHVVGDGETDEWVGLLQFEMSTQSGEAFRQEGISSVQSYTNHIMRDSVIARLHDFAITGWHVVVRSHLSEGLGT
jgi:hypothetical protein